MPQQFYSKLAGVTAFNEDREKRRSRQTIIKRMVEPGDDLVLAREPQNIYDKNAIAVFVYPIVDDAWDEGDYQIGYLISKVASELAPLMDRGYEFVYKFTEITVWEERKYSLGVNISIIIFTSEEMKATRKRYPVSNKILDSPIRNLLNKTSKKYFKIILDVLNQIWHLGKNGKITIGCDYSVVDGDTIHILIYGVDYPLCYIGIDAPENITDKEYYSQEATSCNSQLIEGKTVILVNDVSETKMYDRLMRYVIVDNLFVNYELVKNGYAIAKSYPPDTACDQIYQEAQNQISVINGGLWSYQPSPKPALVFVEPTTAPVVVAKTIAPVVIAPTTANSFPQGCTEQLPGCAIKGNINGDEKIYHVPGSTSYSSTDIDISKGERWFCTEAEVRANGWRASYN